MIKKVNEQTKRAFIVFILGLFLASCASSDHDEELIISPDPKPPVHKFDLQSINELISVAAIGETVIIASGTYLIEGKIIFKQGVSLKGQDPKNKPIFDSKTVHTSAASGSGQNMMEYTTELSDVTIEDIEFHNIGLKIVGTDLNTQNITVKNCVFDYGERKSGTDEKNYSTDKYISFRSVQSVLIEGCEFLRRGGTKGSGRAIQTNYTKDAIIRNNRFGGDDPEVTGYFVTAINDRGTNSLIEGNTIRKSMNWNELDYLDHGIYAVDFNGLTIRNNIISGWPANGSGGSIKARNAQNLFIENNTLNTSGILLYAYEISAGSPVQTYLKNVLIKNNIINIVGELDLENTDLYHGISYWTNYDATNGNEESIRIASNTIHNGYVFMVTTRINSDRFNLNDGGIFNNTAAAFFLKSGINQTENIGAVHIVN